jgi:hypothetical protein
MTFGCKSARSCCESSAIIMMFNGIGGGSGSGGGHSIGRGPHASSEQKRARDIQCMYDMGHHRVTGPKMLAAQKSSDAFLGGWHLRTPERNAYHWFAKRHMFETTFPHQAAQPVRGETRRASWQSNQSAHSEPRLGDSHKKQS